jgi:hypothetical protein
MIHNPEADLLMKRLFLFVLILALMILAFGLLPDVAHSTTPEINPVSILSRA